MEFNENDPNLFMNLPGESNGETNLFGDSNNTFDESNKNTFDFGSAGNQSNDLFGNTNNQGNNFFGGMDSQSNDLFGSGNQFGDNTTTQQGTASSNLQANIINTANSALCGLELHAELIGLTSKPVYFKMLLAITVLWHTGTCFLYEWLHILKSRPALSLPYRRILIGVLIVMYLLVLLRDEKLNLTNRSKLNRLVPRTVTPIEPEPAQETYQQQTYDGFNIDELPKPKQTKQDNILNELDNLNTGADNLLGELDKIIKS